MIFAIDEIPETDLNFAVTERKEDFDIEQPDCSLIQDVEVLGTLSICGRDIYLAGKIKTELKLQCSRCLEPFQFPVESEMKAHFAPREKSGIEHPEVELTASDIDIEFYDEEQVDINQTVHDQILLALPFVLLCRKNCAGLCVVCGINLNKGTCTCVENAPVDPRLEVLRSLKEKLK
jgi:uncharacterized protein